MGYIELNLKLELVVFLSPGKEVYAQAGRFEAAVRDAALEILKEDGVAGGFQGISKNMRIVGGVNDEPSAPPREKHPHAVEAVMKDNTKESGAYPLQNTLCGQIRLAEDVILYRDALPREIRVARCPICVTDPRYRTWASEMGICWACGGNSFTSLKTCTNCGMSNPLDTDDTQPQV